MNLFTILTTCLAGIGLTASIHAADLTPQEEINVKVPQSLKIIKDWHALDTTKNHKKRSLHIVYWTPSDREPAPNTANASPAP